MEAPIIFETISAVLAQNPALSQDFQQLVKEDHYPKHHLLHRAGKVCNRFFILKEGVSRVFYYKEGRDITCWFSFENEIFTAIDSFFQQKPSKYNIELLEDALLYSLSREDMELLLAKHSDFERLIRLFFQMAYVELAERIDTMQFHSAMERYEFLLKKKPTILQLVPLGHIATYLGITQETLSRIRAQKNS